MGAVSFVGLLMHDVPQTYVPRAHCQGREKEVWAVGLFASSDSREKGEYEKRGGIVSLMGRG
jgi:hypothetical protein